MTLSLEMALITKLRALDQPHALGVFDGITTTAERREKARVMVKKVSEVTFTIENGRRITMQMMFVRTYGCDL